MQLDVLGKHETLVFVKGYTVLFSYNTPVAYFNGNMYAKTAKRWSNTTSRHVKRWLDGISEDRIKTVGQSQIDEIVEKI